MKATNTTTKKQHSLRRRTMNNDCVIKCDAMMHLDSLMLLALMDILLHIQGCVHGGHQTFENFATVYPTLFFDLSVRF